MDRGQIWIEAVLYIGIGVTVLVLVLSAGIPLLNRIRDENTVTQTRDVMIALDSNIRTVIGEGAGSQRIFSMEVSRGVLKVNQEEDVLFWEMETEAEVVEIDSPGGHIGNLVLSEEKTGTSGIYLVRLKLSYSGLTDIIESDESGFLGRNDLIIKNIE